MLNGGNIKKVLSLIICVCLLASCSVSDKEVSSLKNDSVAKSFIEKNYSDLDTADNNDFSTFSLLDSSLEGKEVFFTAENHGVKTNSELELKFLKYFKNKTGIKYLLCELSYSDAQVLNKYLFSGDESIIEEMYKPLKGTFAWNKQSYGIWKEIYKYNQSLPKDQRLTVVGIDIEHQYVNAIRYMNSLIPSKQVPETIRDLVSKVKDIYNKINLERYAEADEEFAKKLDQSIKTNRKLYEEFFGEKLFGFELVNENIIAQVSAYRDNSMFNQIRDAKMYDNFKKIYQQLPKGKFYGEFGLNHAFQKRQENVDWVASLMNSSDSPVKGKILSIAYLYKNCKYMNNGDYKTFDLNSLNADGEALDSFAKKDITLFRLTGKDSPFEKELIWPLSSKSSGSKPMTGVTTDYFQYIVIIRNGIPTEPLGD